MVWHSEVSARWLAALIAAVLIGTTVIPADAAPPHQSGTPIRYGDTLSGEIAEDPACQYFWFEGATGDPVTIDMTRTSGSLDGILALYQQDGDNFSADPVATNDDRPGGGLDPLISVTLPAADWYTIAACRLQAEQMRVTTGTFDLTLSGPAAGAAMAPTAPSAGNLSDSIFGGSASPTPADTGAEPVAGGTPAPSPTPDGNLSDVIPGGQVETTPAAPPDGNEFADGNLVMGQLVPEATYVSYSLPAVVTGEIVRIHWERVTGDAAPLLRVLDPEGVMLAEASSPDQVSGLLLSVRAPSEDPLTLIVGRYEDAVDNTTADYVLQVIITPEGGPTTLAPAATDEAATCQSGDQAVTGSGSTDRVSEAYTAAGDSYTADQLTRTEVFATDDDLNVVLSLQNLAEPATVTALFCSPDGDSWDGGVNTLDNGGPYLLGLDWESSGVAWTPGFWFVEVMIDDSVELTIGFTVE